MDARIEIQVDREIQAIRLVQDRLRDFCARHGLGDRIVHCLELAADEILSNVIRHGCHDVRDIRCIAEISNDAVAIAFVDDGRPFDPLTEAPPPDLASDVLETQAGGLGVHIIKEFADASSYRREGERNRLEFTWNRTES